MFASGINGSDKTHRNIQEVVYSEIHHRRPPFLFQQFSPPASELTFVSNIGTDIIPPRKPTCRCLVCGDFIKWMNERPEPTDHHGSSYLITVEPHRVVSGLWLGCPIPCMVTTEITAGYERQSSPLNKEMMNVRCVFVALLWTQVGNLKILKKPALRVFTQEGHDRIS